jgi:hypothetical protein
MRKAVKVSVCFWYSQDLCQASQKWQPGTTPVIVSVCTGEGDNTGYLVSQNSLRNTEARCHRARLLK